MRYLSGDGVEYDAEKSAYWFGKSAEQGFVNAIYAMGNLYEKGIGVKQNKKEAIKMYKKASGDIPAAAEAYKRLAAEGYSE